MRWTHSELINTKSEVITIDEDIVVDDAEFAGNSRINSVRDVHVSGTGSFNIERDLFYVTMRISGTMLVPDAITAEEIETCRSIAEKCGVNFRVRSYIE